MGTCKPELAEFSFKADAFQSVTMPKQSNDLPMEQATLKREVHHWGKPKHKEVVDQEILQMLLKREKKTGRRATTTDYIALVDNKHRLKERQKYLCRLNEKKRQEEAM